MMRTSYFQLLFLATLTLEPVARATLVPSSAEVLAERSCVDQAGLSHDIRVVRYEYSDKPGEGSSLSRSEVLAVEEGSAEDCTFKRLWQDYRVRGTISTPWVSWSAALSCNEPGRGATLFLVTSAQAYVGLQAYSIDFSSAVSSKFPSVKMHKEREAPTEERPCTLGQIALEIAGEPCGINAVELARSEGRVLVTFGWRSSYCLQLHTLTFDERARQYSELSRGITRQQMPLEEAARTCPLEKAPEVLQEKPQ